MRRSVQLVGEVGEESVFVGCPALGRRRAESCDLLADLPGPGGAVLIGRRELARVAQHGPHRLPHVRRELAVIAEQDALARAKHQHQRLGGGRLAGLLQDGEREGHGADFRVVVHGGAGSGDHAGLGDALGGSALRADRGEVVGLDFKHGPEDLVLGAVSRLDLGVHEAAVGAGAAHYRGLPRLGRVGPVALADQRVQALDGGAACDACYGEVGVFACEPKQDVVDRLVGLGGEQDSGGVVAREVPSDQLADRRRLAGAGRALHDQTGHRRPARRGRPPAGPRRGPGCSNGRVRAQGFSARAWALRSVRAGACWRALRAGCAVRGRCAGLFPRCRGSSAASGLG